MTNAPRAIASAETRQTASTARDSLPLVNDSHVCRWRVRAMGADVIWLGIYDGDPKPKPRPRFDPRTGHAHSSDAQRSAEALLAWRLRDDWRDAPFDGPLVLALRFWRATRRRVDLDNLTKLVCDSGQGVLWTNDSQITQVWADMDTDATWPRTVIAIGRRHVE